ncbi:MAG: transglycosylase SLT domain-containing protein, partial [Candidatus Eisenbacteria bacterium]|nr:transglycosylase SLT domain-containing protein [Candidatus Latescibacterota bacterium]MBD3302779.1 transglycosylase SLT domain-containing protein [Candidatus Eisenbacteria bacterium]
GETARVALVEWGREAESGAGAVGLLQLMRGTARETADRWGIPAGPLRRADRNVPLGAGHLADLLAEEGRHLPATLAAYNAGATKCAEWVERFEDIDLFIERIGWWETRAYVRHVLDAAWKYREAYSSDSAGSRPDTEAGGE